jgi:hypothetical protein
VGKGRLKERCGLESQTNFFPIVIVLLGISPASICTVLTFRNHVSVPSSKAGGRLCGVRKGEAILQYSNHGESLKSTITFFRLRNRQKLSAD